MTTSFGIIRKVFLEPGALFAVAIFFAFLESGNTISIVLAGVNLVLTVVLSLQQNVRFSPLLLTASFTCVSGMFALGSGAWLAGCAGLFFSTGNFLNCSPKIMLALQDPQVGSTRKAATHPAVYYAFGYCMTGLMAGGGAALFLHPIEHIPALVMVSLGVISIFFASLGLAFGFLKATAPFWILAAGTAINALAGILAGNILGFINCLFSMLGELRLGWITDAADTNNK